MTRLEKGHNSTSQSTDHWMTAAFCYADKIATFALLFDERVGCLALKAAVRL